MVTLKTLFKSRKEQSASLLIRQIEKPMLCCMTVSLTLANLPNELSISTESQYSVSSIHDVKFTSKDYTVFEHNEENKNAQCSATTLHIPFINCFIPLNCLLSNTLALRGEIRYLHTTGQPIIILLCKMFFNLSYFWLRQCFPFFYRKQT